MKNEYALNINNELIHISGIDKSKKETFSCCNCGNILIARKGEINIHHFSHKNKGNCNFESYLHKVSKIKFFEEYRNALIDKKPFFVEYKKKHSCNSCEKINSVNQICELEDLILKFDLTKVFDKIEIERTHKGFKADILLSSSKNGNILFVEFAVTHKSSKDKKASGIRIIEIEIKTEADIENFGRRSISILDENVAFFNFNKKHLKEKYYKIENCEKIFETFIVSKKGEPIFITEKMKNIIPEINTDSYLYYQILKEYDEFDLENTSSLYQWQRHKNKIYQIKNISRLGIKVKHCYLCQHSQSKSNKYKGTYCSSYNVIIKDIYEAYKCSSFVRI